MNIKSGDIIAIRDPETILALKGSVNLLVKEIRTITEKNNICSWDIIQTDSEIVVVIKRVDKLFNIKLMRSPENFSSGDRADWIKGGYTWLFNAPDDENDFRPCDLTYSDVLFDEQNHKYVSTNPTWFGNLKDFFASVHEWQSDTSVGPHIMVYEYGDVDNANGGVITFLQGRAIGNSDIEVFRQ